MSKQKKTYHHKDLRNALIEKGIEIVNIEGMQAFSLRKVATACGVSHAAPYSHFQNKEELLEAMQQHITDRFSEILEDTIKQCKNTSELLKELGLSYVSFFVENPTYFSFLYSQSNIKIDLTSSVPDEENYKPYIVYKNVVKGFLEQIDYPKGQQNDVIITIWAFIHGITSLATMNNVHYNNMWEQKVVDFMEIFQLSFLSNLEDKA